MKIHFCFERQTKYLKYFLDLWNPLIILEEEKNILVTPLLQIS